jgi:hypothetical protein
VSGGLVDPPEVIEVDHHQRQRRVVALRPPQLLGEPEEEVATVVDLGEPVDDGQLSLGTGGATRARVLRRPRRASSSRASISGDTTSSAPRSNSAIRSSTVPSPTTVSADRAQSLLAAGPGAPSPRAGPRPPGAHRDAPRPAPDPPLPASAKPVARSARRRPCPAGSRQESRTGDPRASEGLQR